MSSSERRFDRKDFLRHAGLGLGAVALSGTALGGALLPLRRAEAAQVETLYFEAESMTFSSVSGISVVSDTGANAGAALMMTNASSAFKNAINFPDVADEVRIKACATRSGRNRWPTVAVVVDGQEVGRWTINSGSYLVPSSTFFPAQTIAAGSHNVELRAISGLGGKGTVFVDWIQFRRSDAAEPPPPTTTNLVVHGIYARGISGGTGNPQWGDLSQIANYTQLVGKKPVIIHGFQQFHDGIPVSGINNIFANYPHFLLTLESGGLNLDQILAGASDAHFDRIGRSLGSISRPIFVRVMHEMNGDWYSYSASRVSDGQRKYRDAFRRAVLRMRSAGATNLKFVWCPNVRAPAWGGDPLVTFYPGDDVVDVLGLDGYAGWRPATPLTFNSVFDNAVTEICAITPSKPLWLCEWGMDAWDYSAAEKERFFDDARVSLGSTRYARVQASLYFHSTQEGYRWQVDDPIAALDNYQGLINDPVYQGTTL